jgi:hypothetical protein
MRYIFTDTVLGVLSSFSKAMRTMSNWSSGIRVPKGKTLASETSTVHDEVAGYTALDMSQIKRGSCSSPSRLGYSSLGRGLGVCSLSVV